MMEAAVARFARGIVKSRLLTWLAPRALLAAGSATALALALLGAELVTSWWQPDYLVATRGLHVFSRTYGWAGRPGAAAAMGGGRATLNARGYRGRELPLPKRGEQTRVVVVGDSIAFGFGVSDEETFPHLLDVRDNGIEAANLGVPGYGPSQELLVLLNEGLRQDPDVVLLAVCLRNDFVDAMLPVALYDGRMPRPRHQLVDGRLVLDDRAVRLSFPRLAVRRLLDRSHLLNRLLRLFPRTEPEDAGWRRRKQEALRDEAYALGLSRALVLEMRAVCRARGIDFVVAAFPSGLSYETLPPLQARFLASLRAEGVSVVDMGRHFRALGAAPSALALDRTGHLGPRAHLLSAEILERELAPGSEVAGMDGGDDSASRRVPPRLTGGIRGPSGCRARVRAAAFRRLWWSRATSSPGTPATL